MVTLSRRFSAAFVLIVALPSLIVSVVLARLYLAALYTKVALQAQATAAQVALNIRSETDSVSILAAALVHDRELRRLVNAFGEANDRTSRYLAARRLDDKLVSFFIYSNRIGTVVLYLKGGGSYTYSNHPIIRGADLTDRSVYADALRDPGKVVLLDSLDGNLGYAGEKNVISIAVCPPRGEETALEGILIMFRIQAFDGLAAGIGDEAASDVVIFGRSGRPLLSSLPADEMGSELASLVHPVPTDSETARSPARELRAGGRSWLATLYRIETTGWTVALLADEAKLSERVTRYQWYLYPALALLAVLFIVYAELFFARIAVPIRAVTRDMRKVGKGDYAVSAATPAIAELAELAAGFNRMVGEIARLQAERERMERERLAAELDALRYQINPHFVANTLNSIKLMASAARADAIAEMTRDLMRLLSDSYAGAGTLAELSREIESVSAYVGIMKVRFGELFGVELALEPGTEALLTLRTILQPIVENSILHGFSGGSSGAPARAERGVIRVSSRLEVREIPLPTCPEKCAEALPNRVLVVEVRDDGTGMERTRAAAILEGRTGGEVLRRGGLHRLGLDNVHRRIRLNFGEPYGLEIESEVGAFTMVRFVLPAFIRSSPPGAPRA
jgi:two-component system, sensor histidine kinase YesM